MDLSEAAKELKRAKQREWYRKNKDRVKENQRRYWERKARKTEESICKNENLATC
jgi:hypothetical protein